MNQIIKQFTIVIILGFALMNPITRAANIEDNDPPVIASVDTMLFEDFNGAEGPINSSNLPEWTVIDSGVPEWDATSWSLYENSSYPQGNGDLARVSFSSANAI